MSQYLMALDQGTTSSRCILFDLRGKVCSSVHREFTQYFPKDGWVEHDPIQIWETQVSVAYEAMLRVGANYQDIAAIGISNQRETVVVWKREPESRFTTQSYGNVAEPLRCAIG